MRKSIRPQSRRHLWLYDEDWFFITKHISPRTGLQPGSWTREMIHRIVIQLREEKASQSEAAQKLWTHVHD
jgi:hypothetical protein